MIEIKGRKTGKKLEKAWVFGLARADRQLFAGLVKAASLAKCLFWAYARKMNLVKLTLFSLLLSATVSAYGQTAAVQDANRYKIVASDGDVLGHGEREVIPRADGGVEVITRREYLFREKEGPGRKVIDEKIVSQTAAGQIISVQNNYKVGSYESQTSAVIGGRIATVTRRVKDDVQETALDLPDDIRFDNGAALLRGAAANEPIDISFHVLDVNAPAVDRVTLTESDAPNADGTRDVFRRTYRGDTLYFIDRLTRDDAGKLSPGERKMFGTGIRREAIKDDTSKSKPASSSMMSQVLVKSPVRIPASARDGKIRYSFKFPDGVSFTAPTTGEQKVTLKPGGFTLDICEDCGSGLPTDPAYLADATRERFWLQGDHKKLHRFSKKIAGKDISDAEKMRRVGEKAIKHMGEIDFAGHVSALEALRRRSGDCTESAVLLAALGRSMGIPTRVVSGIVYSRERYHGVSHTFMPHAWTLAYVDGRWESFDMALDGFDSTHIAFNLSDGDPTSIASAHHLAGIVEWDGLSEVRKRKPE